MKVDVWKEKRRVIYGKWRLLSKIGLYLLSFFIIWWFGSILLIQAGEKTLNAGIGKESTITALEYLNLLLELPENTMAEEIERAAEKEGMISHGEVIREDKKLTREMAAVWGERAERNRWKEEDSGEVKSQREKIESLRRIADLDEVEEDHQDAIVRMFQKGIMIGRSKGVAAQDRLFERKKIVTRKDAKKIVQRIQNKKIRKKISPDGQVIRTTNLPKNHAIFPYILESFPNFFYEKRTEYEKTKYYEKPKEYEDYLEPAKIRTMTFHETPMEYVMNTYLLQWQKTIEDNVRTRFELDYRTIEKNNTWLNKLRNTYYIYGNTDSDMRVTKYIKRYIEAAKKNKVISKVARVTAEPSTLYYAKGYFMRVYVKFQLLSAEKLSPQDEVFMGDYVNINGLKKGVWLEKYFDIGLGSANRWTDGRDFAISSDYLYDVN